jgi:hypothetical protein
VFLCPSPGFSIFSSIIVTTPLSVIAIMLSYFLLQNFRAKKTSLGKSLSSFASAEILTT